MRRADEDGGMRMLVRHQWVRDRGTPRVTTLAGDRVMGRTLWMEWLRLTRRGDGKLFEQRRGTTREWLEEAATSAAQLAVKAPEMPVAISVPPTLLEEWLGNRRRRLSALIAEGVVELDRDDRIRVSGRDRHGRARSLAEITLFEALEATPATAGRFQLNQSVSFVFGARSAEIDLLSREDEIAIEVDGYHHFKHLDHYRRDRRKDLLLQAHGYSVLRFLAEDVLADAGAAIRMVVELMGLKRARESRRKES